jgi:hypothetical protein
VNRKKHNDREHQSDVEERRPPNREMPAENVRVQIPEQQDELVEDDGDVPYLG